MRDSDLSSRESSVSEPLMRVRHLAGAVLFIAGLTAVPLLIVWKQVYITNVSMRYTGLCDSLAVLNKEVTSLKLISERQWAIERIETIARKRLGLEYPTSDQIVIVKPHVDQRMLPVRDNTGFFAVLRKSIFPDKRS